MDQSNDWKDLDEERQRPVGVDEVILGENAYQHCCDAKIECQVGVVGSFLFVEACEGLADRVLEELDACGVWWVH